VTHILEHKGYRGRVEFDSEDQVFFGRVEGIEDSVSFHSDSIEGLAAAFEEAVDDYLETLARVASNGQ
jgi:predicted HicB family RNase H-like nuclease